MIRNHGFDPAFSSFSFNQIYNPQRRFRKGTHTLPWGWGHPGGEETQLPRVFGWEGGGWGGGVVLGEAGRLLVNRISVKREDMALLLI